MEKKSIFKYLEHQSDIYIHDKIIASRTIIRELINLIPDREISKFLKKETNDYPVVTTPDFSSWVKKILTDLDFTQSRLAKEISYSQGDISQVLKNSDKIGQTKRESLAQKILKYYKDINRSLPE